MTLPPCRHRGPELDDGRFPCDSNRVIRIPADAPVTTEQCQRCLFADRPNRGQPGSRVRAVPRAPQRGPGTELVRLYTAAGVPSCQACRDLAARMDRWKVDGCRERLDQIVEEMLPRARQWVAENRPWVHRLLPDVIEDAAIRSRIKADVIAAIAAAESLPEET